MLTLLGFHFVGGILLGLRFRFGVVFAIAAFAGIEGLVAEYLLEAGTWYVISLWALVASQAGYVASAFVLPVLRPAANDRRRTDLPSQAVH
jgi:hypothetical protein